MRWLVVPLLALGLSVSLSACKPGTPPGPGTPGLRALALTPAHPGTLYASTSQGHLLKTLNGGESWSPAQKGLPGNTPAIEAR